MTSRPSEAEQVRVPEFRIELWGYERRSVDAYIAQLAGRVSPDPSGPQRPESAGAEAEVAALRRRVAELEGGAAGALALPALPGARSLPEAGSEAGRLLAEAGEVAEGVQRRALEFAQRAVDDAEAHAARLMAEAQQALEQAAAVRDGAEREAREIVDRAFSDARIEIQRRSASLRADVDRLLEVRDRTLGDLARVRGEVAALLGHDLSTNGAVTHRA